MDRCTPPTPLLIHLPRLTTTPPLLLLLSFLPRLTPLPPSSIAVIPSGAETAAPNPRTPRMRAAGDSHGNMVA